MPFTLISLLLLLQQTPAMSVSPCAMPRHFADMLITRARCYFSLFSFFIHLFSFMIFFADYACHMLFRLRDDASHSPMTRCLMLLPDASVSR
jgi:hypothetical protein